MRHSVSFFKNIAAFEIDKNKNQRNRREQESFVKIGLKAGPWGVTLSAQQSQTHPQAGQQQQRLAVVEERACVINTISGNLRHFLAHLTLYISSIIEPRVLFPWSTDQLAHKHNDSNLLRES